MANRDVLINEDSIIDVADAVRTLTGTTIGYRVTDMPAAITRVSAAGEAPVDGKSVIFIDYDGFVTNSYTAAEAQALTALPSNPSHPGLISQGWNWTLAQIKAYLTSYSNAIITVGQLYATSSGLTEIDIELEDANYKAPYLCFAVNGTCTVDWGDGSSNSTVTGTSNTSIKYTQHTYSSIGKYTIKIDGPVVFYGDNVAYPSILRQRNAVTFHGRNYGKCIKAVRLSTDVTIIGQYAFTTLYNLKYVTIPNTVTTINGHCFRQATGIKAITLPSITAINTYLVYECRSLRYLSLPPTVTTTTTGDYAFGGCPTLYSVAIPTGIVTISSHAFRYNHQLKSVTIPNTVTTINTYAFNQCYNLSSLNITNTITTIGTYAFDSCYSLVNGIIPSGFTAIGQNMFSNCFSLESTSIPSTVTTINAGAYQNCYNLESVTLPNGLTYIGNYGFDACWELVGITLPSTITSFGTYTFRNCKKITTINIPSGVTIIPSNFANGCSALTSITIPDTVTTINGDAIRACTSLKNLTVPASVTTIANNAFYGNNKMEAYHFQSTTPPTLGGTGVFNSIPSTCVIYVPAASLADYQAAQYWSNQAAKMVGE